MQSPIINKNNGMTLVELMVGLVLASIVMTGIYRGFVALISASETQEQMVEVNQSLRVALQAMNDDIRMAGYDPSKKALASFLNTSTAAVCAFTMDTDGDGMLLDTDGDGVVETTILYQVVAGVLQRVENGTVRPLINNVDALDIGYFGANGAAVDPAVDPSLVRQVQVAIVVRSTNEDYSYTDTGNYLNQQGVQILAPQNDNFHRRLATVEIRCRNMGI